MKTIFCTLIVLVVAAYVRGHEPHEMKEVYDQCKSEIGLTEEVGERPNLDDPKVKCFRACMLKKLGEIVNGKIVVEKEIEYLMKHFPSADDAMKQKVTECVHKANEEANECDVAAKMYKCAKENIGELLN